MPSGLYTSGYTVIGKPNDYGAFKVKLTFTDSQKHKKTATASLTVLAQGSGPWTPGRTPLPANAGGGSSVLRSVACGAGASCAAVGIYTDNNGLIQGLIATGADSTWTSVEAPLPGDTFNAGAQLGSAGLTSVACAGTNSCVAIGDYYSGVTGDTGLIDTLFGGTWTAAPAPLPPDAATVQQSLTLSVVACSAAGQCVVVGR